MPAHAAGAAPPSRISRAKLAATARCTTVAVGCSIRARGAKHRGIVLPGALMIASMVLTTSAAWLEASIAQARHAANVHDHLRAAHGADSALALCADALRAGVAPVLSTRTGERPHWARPGAFESMDAYEPAASWPGSARVPQCVIEARLPEGKSDAHTYWITSRGFGANEAVQARVQLMIVLGAGNERREGPAAQEGRERSAWRRIVAHDGVASR